MWNINVRIKSINVKIFLKEQTNGNFDNYIIDTCLSNHKNR